MRTSRRYDPPKDAKFHVSIATTEAIRRKWATPLESLQSALRTLAACLRFQKILEAGGLTVTVRREKGQDIDAACGQLRRTHGAA